MIIRSCTCAYWFIQIIPKSAGFIVEIAAYSFSHTLCPPFFRSPSTSPPPSYERSWEALCSTCQCTRRCCCRSCWRCFNWCCLAGVVCVFFMYIYLIFVSIFRTFTLVETNRCKSKFLLSFKESGKLKLIFFANWEIDSIEQEIVFKSHGLAQFLTLEGGNKYLTDLHSSNEEPAGNLEWQ